MSNNPFAQYQASQTPAQNPQAAFGAQPAPAPTQANPFGAAPAQPQQTPQGAFGGPPVTTAAAAAPAGPAPAQAAAGGFGYGMPDMSQVTESSGRLPQIPAGTSLLRFVKNEVLMQQGHTVRITFVILSTDAQHMPAGSEVVLVQKISAEVNKRGKGLGAILAALRGLMGFADEATMKATVPNWSQILGAAVAGQPLTIFENRQVWCRGITGAAIIDKTTKLPTGEHWNSYQWAPVAAAA